MKRVVRACLALLLGILMTVNVMADMGMAQYPDYVTDYYMIVESPDGGIDFYVEASFDSAKLNTELIPNGTAFHITGELTDNVGRTWGYTTYHGMVGYIALDDCTMVTRSEAIKSELSIAETAAADYDYTTAVTKILYNGPGEKFGKVSGSIEIPAGTIVHIVKEAKLADGSMWGYTSYEYEGWIGLESLVNIVDKVEEAVVDMTKEETVSADAEAEVVTDTNVNAETEVIADANVNAEEEVQTAVDSETEVSDTESSEAVQAGDEAQISEVETDTADEINGEGNETKVAVVAEPTATSTPTPKPTATSTPTPEPTATSTPTPEPTATSTPTPEPTATSTPTPEPTATSTPTPEPTATNTPTPEVTEEAEPTVTMAPAEETEPTVTMAPTEAADEQASSENVEKAGLMQNPIVWIGGISILLIILLLIYHFIKKNK